MIFTRGTNKMTFRHGNACTTADLSSLRLVTSGIFFFFNSEFAEVYAHFLVVRLHML